MIRSTGGIPAPATTRGSKGWWMLSRTGREATKRSFEDGRCQTGVWERGEGTDRRIGFFTDADLPRNGGAAGAVRDTHTARLDAANACS
jgi:hypothetical protein